MIMACSILTCISFFSAGIHLLQHSGKFKVEVCWLGRLDWLHFRCV